MKNGFLEEEDCWRQLGKELIGAVDVGDEDDNLLGQGRLARNRLKWSFIRSKRQR